MSKIQINELNQTTSEFNTLSERETVDILGGRGGRRSSRRTTVQVVTIEQINDNLTDQRARGGGRRSSNGNDNDTDQDNSVSINF